MKPVSSPKNPPVTRDAINHLSSDFEDSAPLQAFLSVRSQIDEAKGKPLQDARGYCS